MKTYAFIDASNIIYGTRNEGWKVDFRKLIKYLTERFKCKKVYYFAGFEKDNVKQDRFYKILKRLGYELILKEVKIYRQPGGGVIRKANCDVDLTFYAMREIDSFDKVIFFSGDGDFEILLKHFIKTKKEIRVFANAKRTAREIKSLKEFSLTTLAF
jgi:uncharacterized LabA/DUF88 family protein